ncbi:prepilin peptidase [Clostridium nigeriense]|uniref:prepilin peptidase n=1 Tax=Clostridium nigeriense TaxID=1805470 RepID=UPI000830CAF3|nr:A24 family peptidase [Clostridium nigeriense]
MYLLILILGLCIGSFLNVCIYRIPREESIAYPPSHCTNCGYELKSYDLVPVFSYLCLKGSCRNCKEKISVIYPTIEILNGIIYLMLFIKYDLTFKFIFYSILASLLIVISIIDIKSKDVYSSTTILGLCFAIPYILIGGYLGEIRISNNLLGGIIGYGIIFLIILTTRGMGEGDADIAGICGLFVGIKGILLSLFLAVVIGGVVASIILILKLKNRKSEIAFGPCIVLGTFIWILFGEKLLSLYLNLFI